VLFYTYIAGQVLLMEQKQPTGQANTDAYARFENETKNAQYTKAD
jgi:hypothetical protein